MAKELAVIEKFQLMTGLEDIDPELLEELEDELGDLDEERGIACRQIKIPSGGGKAFEIESEDPEDPDVEKEIEAVIIFTHRANAYWENAYGAGDNSEASTGTAPNCSSMDGKTGVDNDTGEIKNCDTCPFNQYGADGSGKPCKNIRRVYMMINGKPGVYLLSVPPTSIKDVNKQLARIMGQNKIPYSRMVMKFKLDVATNKAGIKYSKVSVERVGMLPPELCTKTAQMRKELKEKYKEVALTSADYSQTAPSVPNNDAPPLDAGFVACEDADMPY